MTFPPSGSLGSATQPFIGDEMTVYAPPAFARLFENTGNIDNGYIIIPTDDPGKSTTSFVEVDFQGIPMNLSEARKVSFENRPILKRLEPIMVYQYTDFKQIAFDLKFAVIEASDAYDILVLANLLRRNVYPRKSTGIPHIIKMYLGPFFTDFAVDASSGKAQLITDAYTGDPLGINAVLTNYTITPSDKRKNDENLNKAASSQPPSFGVTSWYTNFPSEVSVKLDWIIFQDQLWSEPVNKSIELFKGISASVIDSEHATNPIGLTGNPITDAINNASNAVSSASQSVNDSISGFIGGIGK